MDDFEKTYDELKIKIKNLSEYIWQNRIIWTDVEVWLNNFETNDEKIQMLFLLSQFMYFGDKELRELLKAIYRDKYKYKIISDIRIRNDSTLDFNTITGEFDKELARTKFLGVGNPSESGTHLLYFFRQENKLAKSLFINTHEITARESKDSTDKKIILRNPEIKHYIFIDDLCGSGNQVLDYSRDIVEEIKRLKPDAVVSYYALFAMSSGIQKAKRFSKFDHVEAIYEFDSSFSCFSSKSRHFKKPPSPVTLEKAKEVALKYGNRLWPGFPLGYNNCQLLVGFQHNTPDNTLPIIWFDEDQSERWTPIFKRYNKNYN